MSEYWLSDDEMSGDWRDALDSILGNRRSFVDREWEKWEMCVNNIGNGRTKCLNALRSGTLVLGRACSPHRDTCKLCGCTRVLSMAVYLGKNGHPQYVGVSCYHKAQKLMQLAAMLNKYGDECDIMPRYDKLWKDMDRRYQRDTTHYAGEYYPPGYDIE